MQILVFALPGAFRFINRQRRCIIPMSEYPVEIYLFQPACDMLDRSGPALSADDLPLILSELPYARRPQ